MVEGCSRCGGFSDGVFAIAMTLLVLEIRVPHPGGEVSLWTALIALWPSYLAFGLSFFVILVTWIIHHDLLQRVRAVNRPFLLANGLVLLYVTFVPFPTAVLAGNLAGPEVRAAVTFYCGTFVLGNVTWNLLVWSIERGQLFRPEVDARAMRRFRNAVRIGLPVSVATTFLALVLPTLALVLSFLLRLLWLRLHFEPARPAAAHKPSPP